MGTKTGTSTKRRAARVGVATATALATVGIVPPSSVGAGETDASPIDPGDDLARRLVEPSALRGTGSEGLVFDNDPSDAARTIAPWRADGQATSTSEHGDEVTFGLADADPIAGRIEPDGSLRYSDVAPSTDAVLRAGDNGSTQILTVLKDEEASSSIEYEVELDAGWTLVADDTGGYELHENGVPAASFDTPWAIDADGRQLPTWYERSDAGLVQHIDTSDAAFPVVADPHFTWGITTGTFYFSRDETRRLSLSAANCVWTMATKVPGPWTLIIGAGCAAGYLYARHTYNSGRCVKVKVGIGVTLWADPFSSYAKGGPNCW